MPHPRIGIGYDIHRLRDGAGLVIGGVQIPCDYEWIAHSDGDVLLHAVCDALLGAVAAGDIGEHFPDNDPQYAGIDSAQLVQAVLALPALAHKHILNLDCNIIAQAPRLSAYKSTIRERMSQILGCDIERISVKARSNEELDAIGHKQAIAAQVVVLLQDMA